MHRTADAAHQVPQRGILICLAGLLTGIGLLCLTAPHNPLGASAAGNTSPIDGMLLDFTAKWCGPCQKMSPIVSRLEQQGYPVRKVDVDQERDLAERYGIKTIPTFVLVVSGREVMRRSGETSEAQLRHMLLQIPEYQRELPQQNAPRPAEWKVVENTNEAHAESPFAVALAEPSAPVEKPRSGFTFPSLPILGKPKPVAKPDKDVVLEPVTARAQSPTDVEQKSSTLNASSIHARLRVKDRGGVNFGSGTVIDSRIGRTLILTCGHLFRDLKPGGTVEVDVFERGRKPETLLGQVVDFDLSADVGLVAIPTSAALPVASLGSLDRALQVGEKVASVGCGGGEMPTRESLQITALNKYDGPDNVECTGVPIRGRSGGGLFRGEELIGVCIAADPKDKRGLYGGLKPIYALIEKAGFSQLLPGARPELVSPVAPAMAVATREPAVPKSPAVTVPAFDASLDPIPTEPAVAAADSNTTSLSAALQQSPEAEVICIVRPRNSSAPSRVVIVNQASPKLLSYLLDSMEPIAARPAAPERKLELIPTSASALSSANREFQPRATAFETPPRRPQSPRGH